MSLIKYWKAIRELIIQTTIEVGEPTYWIHPDPTKDVRINYAARRIFKELTRHQIPVQNQDSTGSGQDLFCSDDLPGLIKALLEKHLSTIIEEYNFFQNPTRIFQEYDFRIRAELRNGCSPIENSILDDIWGIMSKVAWEINSQHLLYHDRLLLTYLSDTPGFLMHSLSAHLSKEFPWLLRNLIYLTQVEKTWDLITKKIKLQRETSSKWFKQKEIDYDLRSIRILSNLLTPLLRIKLLKAKWITIDLNPTEADTFLQKMILNSLNQEVQEGKSIGMKINDLVDRFQLYLDPLHLAFRYRIKLIKALRHGVEGPVSEELEVLYWEAIENRLLHLAFTFDGKNNCTVQSFLLNHVADKARIDALRRYGRIRRNRNLDLPSISGDVAPSNESLFELGQQKDKIISTIEWWLRTLKHESAALLLFYYWIKSTNLPIDNALAVDFTKEITHSFDKDEFYKLVQQQLGRSYELPTDQAIFKSLGTLFNIINPDLSLEALKRRIGRATDNFFLLLEREKDTGEESTILQKLIKEGGKKEVISCMRIYFEQKYPPYFY